VPGTGISYSEMISKNQGYKNLNSNTKHTETKEKPSDRASLIVWLVFLCFLSLIFSGLKAFFVVSFISIVLFKTVDYFKSNKQQDDSALKGKEPNSEGDYKWSTDSEAVEKYYNNGDENASDSNAIKDRRAIVEWKSIDTVSTPASNIVECYKLGETAYNKEDYKNAAFWYRKTAEQGYAIGQNNLGLMYERGWGVPQDDKEAAIWYHKAAEQGNASAQKNLGWLYENGRGLQRDLKEAIKWYQLAKNQGDVFAYSRLPSLMVKMRAEYKPMTSEEHNKRRIEAYNKLNPDKKIYPTVKSNEQDIKANKVIELKKLAGIKIDKLSLEELKSLLMDKFLAMGFKAESTPKTGDFGADLIIKNNEGTRIIVQCKRFNSKVNLKAVQEIVGAMGHYFGDMGVVITNNSFLNSAVKLAESHDIELWDGYKLVSFLAGDLSFSEINGSSK
jgi:HJR/Mrr/RecB family endonuclease